ncbi:MAG: hypothetical protein EPGJADBJ_01083 [Saprospiraceae bacterium]|nr:hypothetical protein [Saprospiraceae bacterium]
MKQLSAITLLAFLGLSINVNAQNFNFLWAKQLGGLSEEIGRGIAVDTNGDVFTIGSFNSTADFNPSDDPNTGTYNLTSFGNQDAYVSKLNASGNFLWAKQFGGTSTDVPRAIALDANGNIYITGQFSGTADFDPGPGAFNLTAAANEDIFVVKLNASGDLIWAKRLGGGGTDIAFSIALNAIGNISITGFFRYTADFDPGPGTFNLSSSGISEDIFVCTLDASGNFLWAKQFSGTSGERGLSIAVDAGGNVHTAGYFGGTVDFDPGPQTFNLTAVSNNNAFISKLDPSGNFIWAKQFSGSSVESNSIALDDNSNVITTGTFTGTVDFNPSPFGTYNMTSGLGYFDIFVSKLDANGDFIWAKKMGGGFGDAGVSITLDSNQNIYTTGNFWGAADFDPGDGVYTLGSAGEEDIFISKLNPSGDFVWAARMGGGIEDGGAAIDVDDSGNVYTTGRFFSINADFDPTNGTFYLTPVYMGGPFIYSDAFIEKLCQLATPTINVVGSTTLCQGSSVILEASTANSYLWSNGATTQSIMVTTSGNYSVTVSNASGCSASSTAVTVIVNPTPPPPNITPNMPAPFCQGGSVMLTSSAASSYLWSNGATTQSITVSTAGQYSVTVSNAAGCTAASLSAVPVTVLPLPTATITPDGPTTFCQGGSVILMASSASSYLWSNGATTQNIPVSTTGQYSVTITDINGCTDASPITSVTVNPIPTVTVNSPTICAGQSATLTANGAATYLWSNLATTNSITVSPTATTTYTVTGTTAGCASAPASAQVTVNPVPIVLVSSDTICAGQSATLTASGAATYLWSNGMTGSSISVNPTTITTYTVTGTTTGCASAPVSTQVIVNPLPAVNLGVDTTLQQGQVAVLNATGPGLTYLWSTGANTPTITVNSMGTYSVTVTNGSGCTATDAVVVTIIVSTADLDSKYKLTVSPNPTQGTLNIRCEGSITTQVQIFDNLGRLVLEDNSFVPDGASRTLLLDKLPSGTFHLKIAGNEFVKIVSVVKN